MPYQTSMKSNFHCIVKTFQIDVCFNIRGLNGVQKDNNTFPVQKYFFLS